MNRSTTLLPAAHPPLKLRVLYATLESDPARESGLPVDHLLEGFSTTRPRRIDHTASRAQAGQNLCGASRDV